MEKNKKYLNSLDFYYSMTSLKETLRSGWIYWNVQGTRVESIAEHSWGTQILAISLYSEFDLDVDIYKVLLMLSLHETEEVLIGDITPFDGVSNETKLQIGEKAVAKITKNLFLILQAALEVVCC